MSGEENKESNFDFLAKGNPLSLSKNKKYFGNSSICHYTTVGAMDNILLKEEFHFSNYENLNDLHERCYIEKNNRIFIGCFCSGNTERIPLWYLYSGIDGHGCRFRFTESKMRMFLSNIKTVYPVINGESDRSKPIEIGKDADIFCGWVYYVKSDKTVKFKGKKYLVSDIDKIKDDKILRYFIKDYEWEYEREFRILIMLHDNKNCDIKIAVPMDISTISILFAPEAGDDFREQSLHLPGFTKYTYNLCSKSKLGINMNLAKHNKDAFLNYISINNEQQYVCEKLKCKSQFIKGEKI